MIAPRHLFPNVTRALRRPRFGLRRLLASLGILALLMQLSAPLTAQAADGDWIEICSEFGVVLVQIDLDGDVDDPARHQTPCPGCGDCAVCAAAHSVLPGFLPEVAVASGPMLGVEHPKPQYVTAQDRWLRPETRGPPAGDAEFHIHVATAPTPVIGGAL